MRIQVLNFQQLQIHMARLREQGYPLSEKLRGDGQHHFMNQAGFDKEVIDNGSAGQNSFLKAPPGQVFQKMLW